MQKINTEEIMKQIRAEIKEKGFDSSMLSFEDIPYAEEVSHADGNFQIQSLKQSTEYLNIRNQIDPYKPIEGNPLVIFIKKVIRKLLKFYILPIMTEQNALNLHTANAIQQMNNYIQEQTDRINELESRQEANRQEIHALRSQLKALQTENQELKGLKL